MKKTQAALYLDFENLAISASEVYRGVKMPLNIDDILHFAEQEGELRVKRAYADWSKSKFSVYQKSLITHGFELIHLPETNLLGKNGSDMRLVIDVVEEATAHPQIETWIIGSGDSDFIPLLQYLKKHDKRVVLTSFSHSLSSMIHNYCHKVVPLEKVIKNTKESPKPSRKHTNSPVSAKSNFLAESKDDGKNLIIALAKKHGSKSALSLKEAKLLIQKIKPTFTPSDYGFKSLKKILNHWKGDVVFKIEKEKKNYKIFFNTKYTERKESRKEKAHRLLKDWIERKKPCKPVPLSLLKSSILEIYPDFSERKLGFRTFKDFLLAFKGELILTVETRGNVVVARFFQEEENASVDIDKTADCTVRKEAKSHLDSNLLFLYKQSIRLSIADALLKEFEEKNALSKQNLKDRLRKHGSVRVSERNLDAYFKILLKAGLLQPVLNGKEGVEPKLSLSKNIHSKEELDAFYLETTAAILRSAHPQLGNSDILDLLL